MTLIDQEVKKEEPKGKKIVLFLLIFSILVLIMLIVMMAALAGKQTKDLTLIINGTNITIDNGLLTTDENGVNYISIQKISKTIGYNYLTGEYKQYNEDTTNTKGYLESEDQIIQFEADINKIYKTTPDSNLDYEEYELKNKILKLNNLLYIALDDVNVGLNITYSYSQKDNKILLNTVENLTEGYKTSLAQQTNNLYTAINDSFNNQKAISYDMLVVTNESQKWGVINRSNYSTIIGNKYSSLEFIESADVFIVSDDNKYGVISKEPNQKPIIDLNYEEVSVINNSPLCYQVKLTGKYGVINGEGKPIINNIYDSIGCYTQSTIEESVLVIKDLGKNKTNALVVCKEGKYGLVSLDDGAIIADCILDKIYAKNENGEKKYYIQLQEQQVSLDKYIEYINTTTVNIGQ